MSEDKRVFVVTDNDYWNSADGSGFSVVQGKAKPLPEVTTAIIEDAMEQKLLREATATEIAEFLYDEAMGKAISEGLVQAGNKYSESKKNYDAYIAQKEQATVEISPATAIPTAPIKSRKDSVQV